MAADAANVTKDLGFHLVNMSIISKLRVGAWERFAVFLHLTTVVLKTPFRHTQLALGLDGP